MRGNGMRCTFSLLHTHVLSLSTRKHLLPCLIVCGCTELVEDVIIPLSFGLESHPRFLQEVIINGSPCHFPTICAEIHLGEPPEPRRVVVSHRFGVSEGFKNRVREEDQLFDAYPGAAAVVNALSAGCRFHLLR